jgi:hypothetical protein
MSKTNPIPKAKAADLVETQSQSPQKTIQSRLNEIKEASPKVHRGLVSNPNNPYGQYRIQVGQRETEFQILPVQQTYSVSVEDPKLLQMQQR